MSEDLNMAREKSARHLPEYDVCLRRVVTLLSNAVERGEKVDRNTLQDRVTEYSWYFGTLRHQGTPEASAYVIAAQEFWEAVVDVYNGRQLEKSAEDIVESLVTNRTMAYQAVLPEVDLRNSPFDDLTEAFLAISASPRPTA